MPNDTPFEPVPFLAISGSQQIKAYTDPLRIRILHILADREATNQQLSASLGEPQAKVLHHVRFLLDAGLIRLVDQRIRGGNVEKYYRSIARLFGLRPEPADSASLAGAFSESLTQEIVASVTLWPEQLPNWEARRARLSPERAVEFNNRLNELIAEYWGGPNTPAHDDPDGELMAFAAVTYRFSGKA